METVQANLLSNLYSKPAGSRVEFGVVADMPAFAPPEGLFVCGMKLVFNEVGDLSDDLLDTLVSFGQLAQGAQRLIDRCEPVLELDPSRTLNLEQLFFVAANCKFSLALLPCDDKARWVAAAKGLLVKALQTPQYSGGIYPLAPVLELKTLRSIGATDAAAALAAQLKRDVPVDTRQPLSARYEYTLGVLGEVPLAWAEEAVEGALLAVYAEEVDNVLLATTQACVGEVQKLRERALSFTPKAG